MSARKRFLIHKHHWFCYHFDVCRDEKKNVIHSDDAFAPVGYIRFKKLHLEDKVNTELALHFKPVMLHLSVLFHFSSVLCSSVSV